MYRFVTYLFFILGFAAHSQNKQLLYGFEEIPQSLLVNPGSIAPEGFYVGVPFLSQLHISAGSSGVTVYDIFRESGIDINERISNAIFEMSNSDFFTVNQQLEIVSFGWRSKSDIYFSGGIYQELDMITYFPRDMAILAWEGNHDYIGYEFDFGDISSTGDLLAVYHFGANKKINDKLTVGLRVKLYSSMFNYQSTGNSGTFITRLGDGSENIYEHILQHIDMTVNTSGYASLRDENSGVSGASQVVNRILGRAFFGGNLGVGFDVGATYDINDRWTVSGSILDVGAIFHSNDVETYKASGNYTLHGIELLFPGLNDEENIPYYENIGNALKEQIPIDTLNVNYTQWRPVKMNAGLVYRLGGYGASGKCDCRNPGRSDAEQAVGLQLFSILRPKAPQYAATFFYYRRIGGFLSGKVAYTLDAFSYKNIGIAVAADIGKVNFYMAADNLLTYGNIAKANNLSLQAGLNIKLQKE